MSTEEGQKSSEEEEQNQVEFAKKGSGRFVEELRSLPTSHSPLLLPSAHSAVSRRLSLGVN